MWLLILFLAMFALIPFTMIKNGPVLSLSSLILSALGVRQVAEMIASLAG